VVIIIKKILFVLFIFIITFSIIFVPIIKDYKIYKINNIKYKVIEIKTFNGASSNYYNGIIPIIYTTTGEIINVQGSITKIYKTNTQEYIIVKKSKSICNIP